MEIERFFFKLHWVISSKAKDKGPNEAADNTESVPAKNSIRLHSAQFEKRTCISKDDLMWGQPLKQKLSTNNQEKPRDSRIEMYVKIDC